MKWQFVCATCCGKLPQNPFYGRLHKARDDSDSAFRAAEGNGYKESAALRLLNAALREVEFDNPELARNEASQALARAPTENVQIIAAVVLARAGDTVTAAKLADELEKRHPRSNMFNGYWLPTIRGAIELSQDSPVKAIRKLEDAASYESGQPDPSLGLGGLFYPAYIRGEVYLKLGKGVQAQAEFQKLIDRRGVVLNSPLGALARLGVARGYALETASDPAAREKARAAYRDFFALWKDADADIPIYERARSEYAKLQ